MSGRQSDSNQTAIRQQSDRTGLSDFIHDASDIAQRARQDLYERAWMRWRFMDYYEHGKAEVHVHARIVWNDTEICFLFVRGDEFRGPVERWVGPARGAVQVVRLARSPIRATSGPLSRESHPTGPT